MKEGEVKEISPNSEGIGKEEMREEEYIKSLKEDKQPYPESVAPTPEPKPNTPPPQRKSSAAAIAQIEMLSLGFLIKIFVGAEPTMSPGIKDAEKELEEAWAALLGMYNDELPPWLQVILATGGATLALSTSASISKQQKDLQDENARLKAQLEQLKTGTKTAG